jgi:hypothetical protein
VLGQAAQRYIITGIAQINKQIGAWFDFA